MVAGVIRTKFGREALVLRCGCNDNSAVAKAFAQTENELGKLNIVVANAGTAFSRPFTYIDFDDWWKVMELNVKAPLFLSAGDQSMRERNEGTVITMFKCCPHVSIFVGLLSSPS